MPPKTRALSAREQVRRSAQSSDCLRKPLAERRTYPQGPPAIRILRLPAVRGMTGLPTSTIYALMAAGKFPRCVQLGPRIVGWIEEELLGFIRDRIAERDTEVSS
jgi:prophage regulatory protein